MSFSINSGEIVALLGHNGAGKSTLIDILCGINKPDEGTVEHTLPMDNIGWCPQRQIIDLSLTVCQNIRIARDLHTGAKKTSAHTDTQRVIDLFGLHKYAHRTAETLSGGELRRVQIARSLVNSPQLAILDEPTTGLDPDAIKTVFNYLADSRSQGNSAIVSTHETSRFAQYCTRVIALNQGLLVADLPITEFMAIADDKYDLWEAYKHHVSH